MKNIPARFLVVIAVLFLGACGSPNEKIPVAESPEQVQMDKVLISGKVTAIQPGKDGYTATILTTGNRQYLATISRANLKDPQTYRSVEIGDPITVSGDQWEMENEDHITVREIR